MLIWVPTAEAAVALDGLRGATVEQVAPDGSDLPASASEVEFYVPPFFPTRPAIAAMRQMPRLAAVQALTAGVDRLLPELPDGVTLCNARGAHDASTAEWVVAAILAASSPISPGRRRRGGGATSSPTAWPARRCLSSVTARSALRSSSGWPALRSASGGEPAPPPAARPP